VKVIKEEERKVVFFYWRTFKHNRDKNEEIKPEIKRGNKINLQQWEKEIGSTQGD
jgi:hypothetical protein